MNFFGISEINFSFLQKKSYNSYDLIFSNTVIKQKIAKFTLIKIQKTSHFVKKF